MLFKLKQMQHQQQKDVMTSENTTADLSQTTTPIKSFNAQKKVNLVYSHFCKMASFIFFLKQNFQEYEGFWKLIYLGVSIISAFLLKKIYLFQTMPEFQNARAGTFLDILTITLPFAAAFTLFDLLFHYLFDDFCLKYCLTEQRYQGSARPKRAYTLVKWAYSIVYYAISSVLAYLILKNTSYMPIWLGGSGDPNNIYLGAPKLPQATWQMKIFYLLQFGKHLSRLFSHIFIRAEGNYYQYVLHHALSNFLIFFSYLTNMWLIGVMVLLCHDFSDFFLICCRSYKDTKFCYKPLLQFMYIFGFSSWVFCRLIVFPLCCVYPAFINYFALEQSLDILSYEVMSLCYAVMVLMMALLLVLQIFWTYYIIQSFLSVNITKKVSHNYD